MSPPGPAFRLYLSDGVSSYPDENPEAVLSTFGAATLERVEKVAAEMGALEPDWTVHDLVSGTEWAVREMVRRRPDLDEESQRMLAWAFSYWNR